MIGNASSHHIEFDQIFVVIACLLHRVVNSNIAYHCIWMGGFLSDGVHSRLGGTRKISSGVNTDSTLMQKPALCCTVRCVCPAYVFVREECKFILSVP